VGSWFYARPVGVLPGQDEGFYGLQKFRGSPPGVELGSVPSYVSESRL